MEERRQYVLMIISLVEEVKSNSCIVWVHTMHKSADLHFAVSSLTGFTGTSSVNTEHVKVGKSRAQRDRSDLSKVIHYLDLKNPFAVHASRLQSLSSGAVTSDADDINCDRAETVGHDIMIGMDNVDIAK